MQQTWQAAKARHHFSEVVDAAVDGDPQFIRRRDGKEVVLVSRDYYEQTKPNLKTYLMNAGYAGDNDGFDEILKGVRRGPGLFEPRKLDAADGGG